MNEQIRRLFELSRAQERRIIGLMSGTSLDGLDIALCRFRGAGPGCSVELLHFTTVPYTRDFRSDVKAIFARRATDVEALGRANIGIAKVHAAMVKEALREWGEDIRSVDLLASHGQTIYHAPTAEGFEGGLQPVTLQIGEGDVLARDTGLITLSDFRQKHIAAGGEGAPLAVYGDYFLFGSLQTDRFLVNIGGISNFTFLPAASKAGVMATDTGPGNTLLDACAQRFFDMPFDRDGRMAAKGQLHSGLLSALLSDPFFAMPAPKSTGPEYFHLDWLASRFSAWESLDPCDLLHTLAVATARTIAQGIRAIGSGPAEVFVSGGGCHNPVVMAHLASALGEGFGLQDIRRLGVDPDAKEAVLFALLANETVAGNYPSGQSLGGLPLLSMGKISFPG